MGSFTNSDAKVIFGSILWSNAIQNVVCTQEPLYNFFPERSDKNCKYYFFLGISHSCDDIHILFKPIHVVEAE